jgi:N-acetylglutamate synthase-like GNAT family acetyltransferase
LGEGEINRSRQKVHRQLDCFGVYKGNDQVGFARVVTDQAVFAWILDVFILENYRKHGLSKMLISAVMEHSDLQNLQRWGLCTEDAHGLYERYGFWTIKHPETFMERVRKPS